MEQAQVMASSWWITVVLRQLLATTQILKIKDIIQHLHVMQSVQNFVGFFFLRKPYQTIKIQTPLMMPAYNTVCLKSLTGERSIMLHKIAKTPLCSRVYSKPVMFYIHHKLLINY